MLRIPTSTVIIYRDGVQMSPEVGKEFEFTADEVASLDKANPTALAKPVRAADKPTAADTADKKAT